MKKLLWLSIAVSVTVLRVNGQSTAIPARARAAMDQVRPGWQVAYVSKRLSDKFVPGPMSPEPNVLVGDFDGNGETDYAVLAQFRSGPENRSQLFALLRRQGNFRAVEATDPYELDPNRYLYPRAKGSELYDLNTNEKLVCQFDAIGLHYDCCGCRTFMFRDGRFHSIWTCD